MGIAHVRIAAPLTGLVLFAVAGAHEAGAHEIGTTEVRFAAHADQTWSASITTAPLGLVNKLEVATGQPRSGALEAEALRARLTTLLPELAQQIDVTFDGVRSPAMLAISVLEMPADVTKPAFVVLLATGAIPPHATTATWRYGLAFSTYALMFTVKEAVKTSPVEGSHYIRSDVFEGSGTADRFTTMWIEGDETSRPFAITTIAAPPTRIEIVEQYLGLGFVHILPRGLDHILFVLGIVLLTTKPRPLLLQVTAFTIAHSITLGLTMYGIVSLAPRIVEPLIAVSIAYVAIENVVTSELTPWRPAVVFAFGLLHGMGFAGVLRDLRLPRGELIPALVSFNVGIELAQLTIIAAAFLCIAAWHRDKVWYRSAFVVPASLVIAVTGLFWTVLRMVGF